MAKMNRLDRRGSPVSWFVAVAVLLYCLYSGAIAWSTIDDCDGFAGREWQIFPPEWECTGRPGFG
jgi:hypothetical protein